MNKQILITGGAQRIGKELVNHFHSAGWNVIFQYRSSSDSANELCDQLNKKREQSCQTFQCDFDDETSFKEFCNNMNKNAQSDFSFLSINESINLLYSFSLELFEKPTIKK